MGFRYVEDNVIKQSFNVTFFIKLGLLMWGGASQGFEARLLGVVLRCLHGFSSKAKSWLSLRL